MPARYDVFLSHSSADKPAVEELARKLLAVGLTPFLDKWHLVPGEPWQEVLEEALDQSRTCAVFLGPGDMGAWQNEEMRSALETRVREKSFRVIPVLLPESFEPRKEELPRFLRRLTWVDFRKGLDDEDAFRRLVSGICGQAPGPGGGGGGGGSEKPSLPSSYRCMAQAPLGFVHRSQYEEVLDLLCSKEGENLPNSVGITTALRGAGGFGKTTLAQAICYDDRVRQTYPGGILWATMGENLDSNGRLARIRDLIRWWTREEAPAFETAAAAGARLRELLANSRTLVVLDDVWSSADVTPFQGLANGSALLITTRNSQTLPGDSKRIEVDAMASSEAVELLRAGLPDGSPREFQSLADRLGEWPLLLKLVNGQLRKLVQDGLTVLEALQEAGEALDSVGFSAFDQNDPDSRNAAASRTILVSVQQLSEKERGLYYQLSIFPEDEDIPFSVLERFWGISRFPTRKFCEQLHDLSLLLQFDPKNGTIRLHDVVRKVLIEQIGDGLLGLHRQFLASFLPASGSWSNLPIAEKYLWRNLASHFIGADRKDELRRLLMDFSFLQAKLNATSVNALIADYGSFVEEERDLRLIRDALRLSAHVLARDRQQLASQLFGRLQGLKGSGIQSILAIAKTQLRLRPRRGSLVPPGGPLHRTLEGHSGTVTAVAVVDSRRAVSGSSDKTLRLWDVETGEILRTLEGLSGWIRAVAVVGGLAVHGSDDRTLRVWDVETGETLRTLEGHSGRVNAVAVVGGRRAVSASFDGTLRVWDLETGETLRTLEGHSGWINAVAVVDSHRAVSGSLDGTLRVWDLKTGETLRTLEGHSGWINAVAVVDDRRAVSGSYDGSLRLWDLETGDTLAVVTLEAPLWAVAVTPDGRIVVVGDQAGRVHFLDLVLPE